MPIPKIIHYCWLSGDPFPPKIQKCVNSWRKYLPDYEFMLWDFKRFPRGTSRWVDEAFDAKKYAFASDFLRFHAVYNYGGIYLDCDVEVVKNFDKLLDLPYFIGIENEVETTPEPAFFGAPKACRWVGDCMKYYEGRHFVTPDGILDTTVLPVIMREKVFAEKYTLATVKNHNDIQPDADTIFLLPREFSCSFNLSSKTSPNTYAIHHYDSSWMPPRQRLKNKILAPAVKVARRLLGDKIFIKIKRKIMK